ncbi:LuxR C-terminal-related transcriptional regulator [Mycobacterium haemophilum]
MYAATTTRLDLPLRGRQVELASLVDLLGGDARLITLTGAGGCGKTRLAFELAATMQDALPHGVAVVELATLRDAGAVPEEICRALGIGLSGDRDALARLHDVLRERRMLLVLDNLEQVRDSAAQLATLVGACRGLTMLVTSRRPLRVNGERVVRLGPLAVPADGADAQAMSESPAVQLFCDLARATTPGFAPSADTLAVIAQICRRFDGLPLAIELAAARTGVLPPALLLERLDAADRGPLSVLRARSRDVSARHRDLRATIGWSHDLLDPSAATLFCRLAVFRENCTLESAEAICGDDGIEVFDALSELVDLHLVEPVVAEGTDAFGMLDTIRAFARDLLETSGESDGLAARHAEYYIQLARRAGAGLETRDEQRWYTRIDVELVELIGAMEWLRAAGRTTDAVDTAAALGPYWLHRGQFTEGRRQLDTVDEASPQARGWALRLALESGLGTLDRSDAPGVISGLEKVRDALADDTDHRAWIRACEHLSYALRVYGHPEHAFRVVNDALSACNRSDFGWWRAEILHRAAQLAHQLNDDGQAAVLAHQSYSAATTSGNDRTAARAQQMLTLLEETNPDEIMQQLLEVLKTSESLGDARGAAATMPMLGKVSIEPATSATWYLRTLVAARDIDYWHATAIGVAGIAALAADVGHWTPAARLHGGLSPHLELLAGLTTPEISASYFTSLDSARAGIGAAAFAAAVAEGGSWTWEELVEHALTLARTLATPAEAGTVPLRSAAKRGRPSYGALSPRELEVLHLIAAGHTNRQIAAELFMSPKTAMHHSSNIYRKLGVRGRVEAVTYANQNGLLEQQ